MKQYIIVMVGCLLFISCSDDNQATIYDQQTLQLYKQAIPSTQLLEIEVPQSSAMNRQLGTTAMYPQFAIPVARDINDTIRSLLVTLQDIVALDPTTYKSDSLEFIWGPYRDNESDIEDAHVAVYIVDQGEQSELRYAYAFLRGIGNDLSTYTPVIWGASTPDEENEDHGFGIVLWDFEANRLWEQQHAENNYDSTEGRFAAIYAKDYDEITPENILTWVVASFRDFLPEDAAAEVTPLDLDYLWGKIENDTQSLDYLDFQYSYDLEQTLHGLQENLDIRMAFYDEGSGRAEVAVTDGNVSTDYPGYYFSGVECWDDSIARTYLNLSLVPYDSSDGSSDYISEGLADDCIFSDLNTVPTLNDVDQDLLEDLQYIASHGISE